MKLRFEPPRLRGDGFEGNDIFGRKRLAESIANLADNVEDNFTLVLDAPWGSGKTTFLDQFTMYAEGKGYPVVRFDAFKSDITGDAFSAIAAAILSQMPTKEKASKEIREKLIRAAAAVGKLAVKGGFSAGISYLTAGVLSAKSMGAILGDKSVGDAAADGIGSALENAEAMVAHSLETQAQAAKKIEDLHVELRAVSAALVKELKQESTRQGDADQKDEVQ